MQFTDTRKSMYAFIRDQMRNPEAEKILYYGKRYTAKDVIAEADKVGAYLNKMGIKKGDVVGICLPNIPQAVYAFYGINKIGAIANVIHPKIGGKALKRILTETGTKAAFLFDRFYKKENVPDGVAVIICRLSEKAGGLQKLSRVTEPIFPGAVCYNDIESGNCEECVSDGEEAAVYLHSGGTTGEPKTVVLSSRGYNEAVVGVYESVKGITEITERISMLMSLPIFHGFGLGICMHLTLCMARIVMIPMFRARSAVKLMRREPVNVIVGVPGMFRRLLARRNFKGEFLKNIVMMFCGGDKLDGKLKEKFETRLREYGCETKIMEGYGLSEVSTVCTINVFDPDNGSLGQGIGGVKLAITDGERELPPGETGEIYVMAPAAMMGYLNESSDCIVYKDGEKWIKTGDLGYLDENGCLYFKERIKRLVKIGGVNVYPLEIEESALRHPKVKQACAVRITYENKPAIKLIIVAEKGAGDIKREICEHIKSELSAYAVPRVVEIVDKIKVNAIGKADYRYYENM